jgi:hypothetical protein
MSVPQNLSAFEGKSEDFFWFPIEETPAVPAPKPPIYWGTPEFDAAIEKMYSATRTPEWQAGQARKQQEKAERKRAREARIAELRERKLPRRKAA